MNQRQPHRTSAREWVLRGCVVLMTAWLTMTVAGWLAGGMAEAIVR